MNGAIKSTTSWPRREAAATDPALVRVLAEAASRLAVAGIEAPALEARLLLGHALGCDQATLIRDRAAPLSVARAAPGFPALLARRAGHEPLAHILGRREFWGLSFAVSSATLIPRPDSETLITAALAAVPERRAVRRVLDLGTGSGCLLLAALHEFPAAFGIGVDLSPAALAIAAGNAAALDLAGRAAFLCAAWGVALRGGFDLILCNPPYIESGMIAGLAPEVARFEPLAALDGGADGLDAYRQVIADLPRLLAPGGVAVVELGAGQAGAVAALAAARDLAVRALADDLAGVQRALVLTRSVADQPQYAEK